MPGWPAAVRDSGARLVPNSRAQRLIIDDAGRVTGVERSTLRDAPAWAAAAHRVLHRWSGKPYLYAPKAGRVTHRPVGWLERRYGRPLRVRARAGVVLSAGGFVANRAMMREHAPAGRGGLPLGTPGDDGSGIPLGAQAGGATAFLDRVSVWRVPRRRLPSSTASWWTGPDSGSAMRRGTARRSGTPS